MAEFKHIIRIADTDLKGEVSISRSLRQIKGVDFMFANLACTLAKVDKSKKTGELEEAEIKKLNEVITNPIKSGAPLWMLNRRNDPESGEDKHLIAVDLKFTTDNDIKALKKMKAYRGVRHHLGQPTRGQKTKGNFRENKGKASLGVKRRPGAKSGK